MIGPLEFYLVDAVSNFIESKTTTAYHLEIFHGRCTRGGKSELLTPAFANGGSDAALELTRSGVYVPDIFSPGRNLVISSAIAAQLKGVSNIEFRPVQFKKLVDLTMESANWIADRVPTNPERATVIVPDIPRLHAAIDGYVELLVWPYQDLDGKLKADIGMEVTTGTPPLDKNEVINLSAECFEDFPIFSFRASLLMAPSVFSLLDKSLDRRFFIVRKY